MLSDLILAGGNSSSASGVQITNPYVLGGIGSFVFLVFVMEIVVSGRSFKRETEENARLRSLVEQVVPLSEKMLSATENTTKTLESVSQTLGTIVDLLLDDEDPKSKLKRTQRLR